MVGNWIAGSTIAESSDSQIVWIRKSEVEGLDFEAGDRGGLIEDQKKWAPNRAVFAVSCELLSPCGWSASPKIFVFACRFASDIYKVRHNNAKRQMEPVGLLEDRQKFNFALDATRCMYLAFMPDY